MVETRAFENNCADPCHHLVQGIFSALRAGNQSCGCHRLVRIKMVTAIIATVTVGRHVLPFRAAGRAEVRPAQAVRRIILARDKYPRGSIPQRLVHRGMPAQVHRGFREQDVAHRHIHLIVGEGRVHVFLRPYQSADRGGAIELLEDAIVPAPALT